MTDNCYMKAPRTNSRIKDSNCALRTLVTTLLLLLLLRRFSRVRLFETLWTAAHQAPLSMGFSMQEYWSGLSCPAPGNLPDPRVKPTSLMSPA